MAMSRAIKQELLEESLPEVYALGPKPRRRKKVKTEVKVDVKTLVKKKSKSRRAAKEAEEADVEFVRQFAPRRPYSWKGRRVTPLVRPGVPVVFTPGQRTSTTTKRDYDHVYGDPDILEQAEAGINEFRYGKRARLLTDDNPTPGQVPVTEQEPLITVLPGQARLLPTVQVLVPKKRRGYDKTKKEAKFLNDPFGDLKTLIKKEESKHVPVSVKREAGDIKVEDVSMEQVTPSLAVHTVDIKIPLKRKREDQVVSDVAKKLRDMKEEPYKQTVKMEYQETPEVLAFDPGVEPTPMFEAPEPAPRRLAVPRTRKRTAAAAAVAAEAIATQAVAEAMETAAPAAAAANLPIVQPMEIERGVMRQAAAQAAPPVAVVSRTPAATGPPAPGVPAPRTRGRVRGRYGPANRVMPEVWYHPSITPVRAYRRSAASTTRRRRRRRPRATAAYRARGTFRAPSRTRSGVALPVSVAYHPSIVAARRR